MELGEQCAKALDGLRTDLGFSSPLDRLETRFLLTDQILKQGFISTNLEAQVIGRITGTLRSWADFLNGLLMPNPTNQAMLREAQALSDEQRDRVSETYRQLMLIVRRGDTAVFFEDHVEAAKVIDDSLALVDGPLTRLLSSISPTLIDAWKKEPEPEERPFYG